MWKVMLALTGLIAPWGSYCHYVVCALYLRGKNTPCMDKASVIGHPSLSHTLAPQLILGGTPRPEAISVLSPSD